MDYRDFSFVHIRTRDGWEEVAYSDCRSLLSPFIDLMSDPNNLIHYLNMPDVSSSSIRHLLNIFSRQFTVSFNEEDIDDIKDTAKMLGVSGTLSNLVVKKFRSLGEEMTKPLFYISRAKDVGKYRVNKMEEEHFDLLGGDKEESLVGHKCEDEECKLEPLDEETVKEEDPYPTKTTKRKYTKGGTEDHYKKIKERLESTILMRSMVMAEPDKVRLFTRGGSGQIQEEMRQFPGLIFDNQKTKFNICVVCCEVFFNRTASKVMKHECVMKTEVMKDKPIEVIETRSKFHNSIHLRQYYTEISVDKIRCNQCLCELKKISDLKEHLRKVHNINPSNIMCPECGNRYSTGAMLRQHQTEKHGRTDLASFPCELCHRIFVSKCLLSTHHKLFHTDEKPNICDVCGQGFKRKPHLDRHKLVHTGARDFPCRHCEMAFSTNWTRTQHERIHLGIKPYKCEECDKHFAQKTSLDSHNKVYHTNTSPGFDPRSFLLSSAQHHYYNNDNQTDDKEDGRNAEETEQYRLVHDDTGENTANGSNKR